MSIITWEKLLTLPLQSVENLTNADCQGAFLQFASENCCYSKAPAQEHTISRTEPSTALHVSYNPCSPCINLSLIPWWTSMQYTLETFCEARTTGYAHEPFRGQPIDGMGNGIPPPVWNIPCAPDQMFRDHVKKLEVPHTATIQASTHFDWQFNFCANIWNSNLFSSSLPTGPSHMLLSSFAESVLVWDSTHVSTVMDLVESIVDFATVWEVVTIQYALTAMVPGIEGTDICLISAHLYPEHLLFLQFVIVKLYCYLLVHLTCLKLATDCGESNNLPSTEWQWQPMPLCTLGRICLILQLFENSCY